MMPQDQASIQRSMTGNSMTSYRNAGAVLRCVGLFYLIVIGLGLFFYGMTFLIPYLPVLQFPDGPSSLESELSYARSIGIFAAFWLVCALIHVKVGKAIQEHKDW